VIDDPITPREPWRCQSCNALMYNLNENGHPTEGAPFPKFFSNVLKELCTMCHSMLIIIDNFYWKNLHNDWKHKNESLGSDGKYFPGDK
jgi:hypothetical protein